MDINKQNNKVPELSVDVFTSSCKVINIEEISNTNNINKKSLEIDNKIKNKKDKWNT